MGVFEGRDSRGAGWLDMLKITYLCGTSGVSREERPTEKPIKWQLATRVSSEQTEELHLHCKKARPARNKETGKDKEINIHPLKEDFPGH